MAQPWWKSATGYQIYPRSFCDSNGDGVGDIPGIISKLDHLADLGIGFVWLSPVYASPMRDNGYDIADYFAIAPEFGTLDDFDRLVEEAGRRNIRIVMDLVVNHCSSDHEWFQKACQSRDLPEHDYFYWRDPDEAGGPPDDQRACFGGPAWIWVEAVGQYYYGHFGPQQPDLNWQNPALRQTLYAMMNWWLDRGIGGFRMDVIDLIGKDLDRRLYAEGPYLRAFIQEMHEACLAGRDIVTVGEAWSASPDTALSYCGSDARALDMVFHFNHIEAAWDPQLGRFGPNLFALKTHKRIMNAWQQALSRDGWNSLFLSNHDLPRAVSHYADDGQYRERSAKMLATATYLMKGTPFIYQGEEIGMTNVRFTQLDQFRDIETLGQFDEARARGVSLDDFIKGANANGRDNARTPVQWTADTHAGFTAGTPWIGVNDNYAQINVEADRANPDGVLAYYRALIALRRRARVVVDGAFEMLLPDHESVLAYCRTDASSRLLVLCSYADSDVTLAAPDLPQGPWRLVLSNIALNGSIGEELHLPAYFAGVWLDETVR